MALTARHKTIGILVGLALFCVFPAFAPPVDVYTELDTLMKIVLKRFPPNEYHYVCLGRSPAAIGAYLDAAQPGLVSHVPLSEFYHRPGTDSALDAATEKRVFDHFDAALKDMPFGKKKMLVVDFVMGGGSLVASLEYLEKYMAERHKLPGPIQALALSPTANPERIPPDQKNIEVIPLLKDFPQLNVNLAMYLLKYRSKYDRFAAPFDNSKEVLSKPNPDYADLVNYLRKNSLAMSCLSWLGTI